MGTSWEGTKWKAPSLLPETLGQRLGVVGRRLSRPLALCLFLAAFPVLAISTVVFDPTPASSGSCTAYTTINNSVRSRTEADCKRPYDRHRVQTELYTDAIAQGSFVRIGHAEKVRAKGEFSVETNRKYVGCAKYLGFGAVRFQARDYSRTRFYCR